MTAIVSNQHAPDDFKPLANQSSSDAERAMRRVAEAAHRMNEAIARAVNAGISVELIRVARQHDGLGAWGDQIVPFVRE
jgi:hypothetical protein